MATDQKRKTFQTTISLTKMKGEILLNALQSYKANLVSGYQNAAVGEEELVKWAKYLSVIDRITDGVKRGMERIERQNGGAATATTVEDAM